MALEQLVDVETAGRGLIALLQNGKLDARGIRVTVARLNLAIELMRDALGA